MLARYTVFEIEPLPVSEVDEITEEERMPRKILRAVDRFYEGFYGFHVVLTFGAAGGDTTAQQAVHALRSAPPLQLWLLAVTGALLYSLSKAGQQP